jgi:starch synthase
MENKTALQSELGLEIQQRIPLLAMVTRLHHQKGIDLVLDALSDLATEDWPFVLLGTGDPALEVRAAKFADTHSGQVRFIKRFDPNLARRIYGGCDMIIIPSRYEPCGLAQMIAMRYGSIPIVRSTGGLKDTVKDINHDDEGAGFNFGPANPSALKGAIKRGLSFYGDERAWRDLQTSAMKKDFSWNKSAQAYNALYKKAILERSTS